MQSAQQLAQFLRARRARVVPDDVSSGSRRRVPGLRREEVAHRAGVSADYYMRLEQGRGHQPSRRVLEGLARALQLDDDATAHLMALGAGTAPATTAHPATSAGVTPWLQDLLDCWTTTAAFVHGSRLDVLAANSLARALTPVAEPGTNMLRSFFLDEAAYGRYHDVEVILGQAVAYFRAHVSHELDDPDVIALIDELSQRSPVFRGMWARHDVLDALVGYDPYRHPTAGLLHLRFQTFAVDGSQRHTLFVVSAAPHTADADALANLTTGVSSGR